MTSETTSEPKSAYAQGIQAGMRGLGLWRNPYSQINCGSRSFHEWFAGWCYGMQQLNATKPD